ncbi:Lrp/AsnC family transcriptional regulator [Nocardiopsis sp. HNM0947]|uniref:Lrp/AsnC family transcriptional regulator n=1 Tax=Nocardiopsis coralli TaxID=2772213 RepID=A0ABR9P5W2_9ACTN|nr:Lrp/AsnC family transcriptional regulator [Nocardiopsis coralli]MBE2999217.1 Lrp/AsnC family transcriptional regulator [Nocardiopsis coralli]
MQGPLEERDRALVHALQIAPRATWTEIGRTLGVGPATAAARWERLHEQGVAWMSAYPTGTAEDLHLAFVEVDVEAPLRHAVREALCRDPRAVSVEETAGDPDLFLTVMVPDQGALSRLVLDDLPRIPGVSGCRTHVASRVHWEGSRWRLDALDARQQARLRPSAPDPGPPGHPRRGRMNRDAPLVEALCQDGRRSAAEIARRLDRSPATVRRQAARLLSSGHLSLRCELAQPHSGWPLVCTWFARVPGGEIARTVRSLTTHPQLRLCVSTVSGSNLLFTFWARNPEDLGRLESVLEERLPAMTLTRRVLTLRTRKRMGWILDGSGRSTGEVVTPDPTLVA